jgi:hypothetical protein
MTLATPYTLTGNGQTYSSSIQPTYDRAFRFWRCADANGNAFNVSDLTGTVFAVSGTVNPDLTAMQVYDAFTVVEEVAIDASTDPFVVVFAKRLARAFTSGTMVQQGMLSEGLAYLSVTMQQPATVPPSTYILPARVAQISQGIPQ